MVYIASDGSIVQGTRPQKASSWTTSRIEVRALIVVVAALALRFATHWYNPLANGAIPASQRLPHQHWSHLAKDTALVRTLTEYLSRIGPTLPTTTEGREAISRHKTYEFMESADFGGADGHVAERLDISDIESMRTTRCSTTRSAVTGYFCGAAVATNQDVALGKQRKGMNFGLGPFRDFLQCRYEQGRAAVATGGQHKSSVYRLGIGCSDNLAGYSHAFSIIAQPDGTFYWLQSYISQYSLAHWMSRVNRETGRPLGQFASLEDLFVKLEQVERLMLINDWTEQANADYDELFGVNKNKDALKRDKPVEWKPSHRLEHFYWDEACEYPTTLISSEAQKDPVAQETPRGDERDNASAASSSQNEGPLFGVDECERQNVMTQLKSLLPEATMLELEERSRKQMEEGDPSETPTELLKSLGEEEN